MLIIHGIRALPRAIRVNLKVLSRFYIQTFKIYVNRCNLKSMKEITRGAANYFKLPEISSSSIKHCSFYISRSQCASNSTGAHYLTRTTNRLLFSSFFSVI